MEYVLPILAAAWLLGLGWACLTTIRDIIACTKDTRRILRKIKRLSLKKQDWTPREDPALWTKE